MYKVRSIATQPKRDKKGTVKKDKDGNTERVPAPCLREGFNWPADGVIVPDDFFANTAQLARLVAFPAIEVLKSEDGETWEAVELPEDEGAGAGTSPSGVRASSPGPSAHALAGAAKRGIHVSMPNTDGPVRDGAVKIAEHIQQITGKKKRGRPRRIP